MAFYRCPKRALPCLESLTTFWTKFNVKLQRGEKTALFPIMDNLPIVGELLIPSFKSQQVSSPTHQLSLDNIKKRNRIVDAGTHFNKYLLSPVVNLLHMV